MIKRFLFGVSLCLLPLAPTGAVLSQETSQDFPDAVRKGEVERVRTLLEERPGLISEVDEAERTGLYHAVDHGFREIIELLTSHGSDVNARDHPEAAPLKEISGCARLVIAG